MTAAPRLLYFLAALNFISGHVRESSVLVGFAIACAFLAYWFDRSDERRREAS